MYVPSHGGAEISMYSLLKKLKEKYGWEILTVTDERYSKTKKLKQFNEIRIHTVSHKNREKEIEKEIIRFKPNVIITQLMWGDIALKLANKCSIPSIMRVCKVPLELNLGEDSEYSPTSFIATSNYVKKYIKEKWNRKAQVIRPLVETKDYIISDEKFNSINSKYIFMFNPLIRKGGIIFKEIAKRLHNKNFGAVLGWSSLKESPYSNSFSKKYIKRITESEGSKFDGSLPIYVDLKDCRNVDIFRSEDDIRTIYKKTRLLLIPSQWEEAFGRVAVEAMINGIPVIGSNVGGLKEAIGKGGILLDKNKINLWIEEILKFDDLDYYKKMSERAKKWVKRNYSENKIVEECINLIKNTVKIR